MEYFIDLTKIKGLPLLGAQTRFSHEGVSYTCDSLICVAQAEDREKLILLKDFHCMGTTVPAGFTWDGASSPKTPFASFVCRKFYKSLVSSCYHDYKCGLAKCDADRLWADKGFFILKKYVDKDSSWRCRLGYDGVRVGAYLGIGSSYK